MSGINADAIKECLKLVKNLQDIEKKYGRETLEAALESIQSFFGVNNLFSPENTDKNNLKEDNLQVEIKEEFNQEQNQQSLDSKENDGLDNIEEAYEDGKDKQLNSEPIDERQIIYDKSALSKVINDFEKQKEKNEINNVYEEETNMIPDEQPEDNQGGANSKVTWS